MAGSRQVTAIILKRSNYGEADRVVTLYSAEEGKLACMARGVRKIVSKKRSALEPGTLAKVFLTETHGMPLITQAMVINEFSDLKSSLVGAKKLFQILEMMDAMTSEADEQVFDGFLEIIMILNTYPTVATREISDRLNAILQTLGFQDVADTSFRSVTEYIEFIAEKRMKAWEYFRQ